MGNRVQDEAGYGRANTNQHAVRVIPWAAGISADAPVNDCECSWSYSVEGKCFRLKFVNHYCRTATDGLRHKDIPNS